MITIPIREVCKVVIIFMLISINQGRVTDLNVWCKALQLNSMTKWTEGSVHLAETPDLLRLSSSLWLRLWLWLWCYSLVLMPDWHKLWPAVQQQERTNKICERSVRLLSVGLMPSLVGMMTWSTKFKSIKNIVMLQMSRKSQNTHFEGKKLFSCEDKLQVLPACLMLVLMMQNLDGRIPSGRL